MAETCTRILALMAGVLFTAGIPAAASEPSANNIILLNNAVTLTGVTAGQKRQDAKRESAASREALFPGWGECRYNVPPATNRTRHSATAKRNLLIVNAIGDSLVRLYNVERNVARHFDTRREGGRWDCLVNSYGSLSNEDLSCIMQYCEVQRQHNQWGGFLLTAIPTLIQHYAHVALLLDDVWLPDKYDVARDILEMKLHGIDVMSPAVHGSNHAATKYDRNAKACLWSWPSHAPSVLEYYFTVFSAKAWSCFYHSVLQQSMSTSNKGQPESVWGNPSGCGYDTCLPILCPDLKFGIERRSDVWHIEPSFKNGHANSDLQASGFGREMDPHNLVFTKKGNTQNKCNWRISVGNCSVEKVIGIMSENAKKMQCV